MSPEEYAEMSAERLLTLFVDDAKRLGLGRGFRSACGGPCVGPPIAMGSEEGKRLMLELRAIRAALYARPTIPDLAALMGDDDSDVRMAAAMFFNNIDPERAHATFQGVMAGCSADEVSAARQRARTPPPPRPTLQELSDEALLARFQDAGERLAAFQFLDWEVEDQDMDARNAVIAELTAIGAEIKRRGMLVRLAPFLDSPNPEIRQHAAAACLRVAPEKAVATLERLAATSSANVRAAAGWTLDRWRAGECYVDKW